MLLFYMLIYVGHSEVKRKNFGQTAEKFPMAGQHIFLAYLKENTVDFYENDTKNIVALKHFLKYKDFVNVHEMWWALFSIFDYWMIRVYDCLWQRYLHNL